MSTKVGASIKSVSREDDQTTITLVLESPFHTTLSNEDVFLELHTMQGNKVEFHKVVKEAEATIEVIEQVQMSPSEEVVSNAEPVESQTETISEEEPTDSEVKPKKVKKTV